MPNLTCKYENEVLVAYRDYDFDVRQLGREKKLQCRDCGGFVHLKKGKLKIAHFAHFSNQQIPSCSKSNESIEHLECKSFIAKLLESRYSQKNVFPEHKVESGQEADVYLELPTVKIAFEIQFSQQSEEEWKIRTERYKKHNIVPIWILGFRKGINELQKERLSDFAIPQTMQNAGIELPKFKKDWERYFEQTPYIRECQRNKTHIFHFIVYESKKVELYVAYLGRIQDAKTLWFGEVFFCWFELGFSGKGFSLCASERKIVQP